MVNVIQKALNKFTKGLVMDFSPENTKNEVLTHALNATLLTFNGNELSLQNDMGNGRVETAFLPEGYIPVGVCEYGGIIYIVSYNPLEDKSQIGCFPSPERNVSLDELGNYENISITYKNFLETIKLDKDNKDGNDDEDELITGDINLQSTVVLLRNSNINPGDKFIVYTQDNLKGEKLQDYEIEDTSGDFSKCINPIIKLSIVSIEDSGRIKYLNNDLRKYINTHKTTSESGTEITYKTRYHIPNQEDVNIDKYRDVLSSGYNVFKEKTSGKLAILAELITIDAFSVTHSIKPSKSIETIVKTDLENGKELEYNIELYSFDVFLHFDVMPLLDVNTYDFNPKLAFYQLTNSNLLILTYKEIYEKTKPDESTIKLQDIIVTDSSELDKKLKLLNFSDLKFLVPTENSFHQSLEIADNDTCEYIYLENNKHYILNGNLSKLFQGKVYELTDELTDGLEEITKIENDTLYRFTSTANLHKHIDNFVSIYPYNDLTGDYSKYTWCTPVLKCKKSAYIADKATYSYQDVRLASFKLPKDLVDAGFNFPVKYDYTITPCMEYGKLPHLQVLNIVDLNHLNDFQASNFNIWYYRIDGDQLTLTFGAEVFDTFETYKVDGLVLEFYDWRGFAGSLEISDKKSYSGKFTTIITLNSPGNVSNKKINTNKDGYSTDFVHNINIIKEGENKYKLGEDYVKYSDSLGWSYENSKNELLNDCGTLYSNIIYGVKPYLRINENGKYKFIKKSDMFLFTLPILNDYCYKVSNFNTLELPELNLLLTYRIEDSSKVIPYNDNNITDGYSEEDYKNISDYKLGIYSDKNLSVIRYMQYEGTSKLNLEVGLHKDYENFNLSCDSRINEYFECNLQLIGTDDKSFQELLNDGESLNTKNISNKDNHYLKFENNESIYPITNILKYNFITAEKTNSISINYKYLVGYSIDINNIASTNIPVTTICALCYKSDTGKYNYEDFEVYETLNYNDIPLYYSNFLFYNTGNSKEFEFGSCRMVDLTATATNLQTIVHRNIIKNTDTILKGLLNTGDMLRTICSIGKLAFCVPHLHTRRDNSYSFNYTDASKYRKNIFDLYEESRQYSMCAVTPTMINHYTKFVDASLDTQGLKYFSPMEVAKFNRCLIKTMLNVYAYNPDVTSVYVKIGEISIKDPKPKFISNLLSTNSRLITTDNFNGEDDFNELVKIGGVTVDTYLTDLKNFSEIEETSAVKFKPNFTYCGTKDEYYLISELTYKLPLPNQLYQDLQLEGAVFVKHHDGSYDFINGQFDQNSLYGWYPDLKQLVGLDVSNYTIDRNTGKLDIIEDAKITSEVYDVLIAFDLLLFENLFKDSGGREILDVKAMDKEVELTIDSEISAYEIIGYDDNWVYAYKKFYPTNESGELNDYDRVNYSITISLEYFTDMSIIDSNMEILVAYMFKSNFLTDSNHDVFSLITKSSFQNMPQGYDYNGIHKGVHLYDELFQNTNSTIYLKGTTTEYFNEIIIHLLNIYKKSQKLCSLDKTLKIITCGMSFAQSEPVICIYRFRKPNLNVRCVNSISLSNINVSIIPAIKTSKYSYKTLPDIVDDPEHYEVYDIYSNATLVGSSITINDLVYYPENVGHRLFIKDSLYGSLYSGLTLYVDLSDLAILEQDTDGLNRRISYVRNNPDHKNKLTISLGPSYTLLDIKELDPELNSVNIYE